MPAQRGRALALLADAPAAQAWLPRPLSPLSMGPEGANAWGFLMRP